MPDKAEILRECEARDLRDATPEVTGILTIDVIEDQYSWNVHYLGESRWLFPKTFPSAQARANAFAQGARSVFALTMPRTEIVIVESADQG